MLYVSQDPITSNGQCASAFWKRITKHYQKNWPEGYVERSPRSEETKWVAIKHNVNKFCGVYNSVLLRESGTSNEDALHCALDLQKIRHPRQQPLMFMYCSRLLKDIL